jgi:hypothetical protein
LLHTSVNEVISLNLKSFAYPSIEKTARLVKGKQRKKGDKQHAIIRPLGSLMTAQSVLLLAVIATTLLFIVIHCRVNRCLIGDWISAQQHH